MNRQQIIEAIRETKDWEKSFEKDLRLKSLITMLSRRGNQTEYLPDIFLFTDQMRIPSRFDKAFHWLGCDWLEYDDNNVFDGTRRICLICGLTSSSPLKRKYGYEHQSHNYGLNLENLLKFIEAYSDPYSDYWRESESLIRELIEDES